MNPHSNYNFHLGASSLSSAHSSAPLHPGPATSPTQSVPGRRTPLGAVGIGGFYAQSSISQAHTLTDENQPEGSRERLANYLFHFILDSKKFLLFVDRQTILVNRLLQAIKVAKQKVDKEKQFD